MKDEIRFQTQVLPSVRAVMAQMEIDSQSFGITPDELERAIFVWLTDRWRVVDVIPEWLNKYR